MAAVIRFTCASKGLSKVFFPLNGCSRYRWKTTPILFEHSLTVQKYAMKCPYSTKKGFLTQLIDNIRQDITANKEMKESLKKFRKEAEKLEQSEALQKARSKYKSIELETSRGSQQIKEQIDSLKEILKEGLEEAQKSEIGKKGKEISDEIAKSAKSAAEALAKQSEQIGKSTPVRAVAEGVKVVKEQIEETSFTGARIYRPPEKLHKRTERSQVQKEAKHVEPNLEATGVELHKDSKWFQSWQNFKDNNQYFNKFFDLKMRYDESDNPVVRASRLLTDKVTDLFGGLFQKTELSEVLTEVVKMDPTFNKEQFLKECEFEIIPNILEAINRGDLEILKDWCHEAPFNVLSEPIKQAKNLGYQYDSRILDICSVDLAMGKIMEQGPVLVVTFQSQQILAVRNAKGEVVEGDPDKVLRIHHVWVLCRDQTELDPKAAWKLMDLSANPTEQWL